jgi:hypothetical protein
MALFFTSGFRLGRLALFQIRKPRYEKLLAEATSTRSVPRDAGHYEEGPPERFAFYWQRGIIDNWAGVVHDPTGEIMNLGRDDIRLLFGGVIYKCEPLGDGWYLCWFT